MYESVRLKDNAFVMWNTFFIVLVLSSLMRKNSRHAGQAPDQDKIKLHPALENCRNNIKVRKMLAHF